MIFLTKCSWKNIKRWVGSSKHLLKVKKRDLHQCSAVSCLMASARFFLHTTRNWAVKAGRYILVLISPQQKSMQLILGKWENRLLRFCATKVCWDGSL